MKSSSENSNKFSVVLNGIKLPENTKKELADEIRKSTLKVLATLDFHGSCRIRNRPDSTDGNGGQTDGIWTDFEEDRG